MQLKKLLALLLSAALALSLLAGCGNGSKALSDVIADLLSGQYANVTVEIDPDLEGDLRQAVHEGETEEEIRAALEKILGSGVSFRLIGDGQQGDSAWNLILYPGNDPDAAARSAFTEWNKVFGSLPRDGQYSAGLAMLETDNGYAILVQATVEKAGSRDDGPDDLVVKGNGFTYNVTKNTITVELDSKGMQELFFSNPDTKVEAARNNGFEDIIITLKAGTYTVSNTFTTPFKGTLQGESEATITLTGGSGLFAQIAGDGKVENLNITVAGAISNDSDKGNAGAVAGVNNGTISGCEVTINGSISGTNNYSNAGGIVGYNYNEISGCEVTINGSISGGYAGGIAGCNEGTISSCKVNGSGPDGDPQIDGDKRAGGIAGLNKTSTEGSNKTSTIEGTCTVTKVFIKASASSNAFIHAGGIVGSNEYSSISGTCTVSNCIINAQNTGSGFAYAGGIVGYNKSHREIGGGIVSGGKVENGTTVSATCNAIASAGGIVGYNSSVHDVDGSSIDNDTCTITATYTGDKPTMAMATGEIGGTGDGSGSGAFAGTKIGYQAE